MTLATKKSFGQHWLHDPLVIGRIADACVNGADLKRPLVEIGPGEGALTKALMVRGAQVVAIELDPRCVEHLSTLPEVKSGQLTILEGDALALDWPKLQQHYGVQRVVGNLPYNVGTEITARLMLLAHPLERMVFLLQKEVVLRLVAHPNTSDWGRLGVLTSLLCEAKRLFDVGPGAFSPPPKVMSSVVELKPLQRRRYDVDLTTLDKLLRAGFGQRRKMLRSALKGTATEAQILAAEIDPTLRMEALDLAALCRLARLIV